MIRLSVPQIVLMHDALLNETGGLPGIRDEGLLDLSANAPFQTFDGEYVYPSLEEKAARLSYFIIRNHPFLDGNKRVGMLAMMVFMELNGVMLSCTNQDIVEAGLRLARGDMDDKELLEWIYQHK